MKLVDKTISKKEISKLAKSGFGNMVKAVVDIKNMKMVVDGSLHADEEAYLLSTGSQQTDLWGVNLYPELKGSDFIEFDSMINLHPNRGNMSRGVDDPKIQKQIRMLIFKLVK